jgi:hypothetical protein
MMHTAPILIVRLYRAGTCVGEVGHHGYAEQRFGEARLMFAVTDLQAVEPEALEASAGIRVEVDEELDSMGFPRVSVFGETRDQVIAYVRDQWGDDDPQWFAEYVVARVEEI